jgi:hypothetical protein
MAASRILCSIVVSLVLFGAPSVQADTPPLFPIQGVLTDADGVALDGSVAVRFALYDSVDGATALWEETRALDLSAGAFTAYLGESVDLPPNVFRDQGSLWLGVTVDSDEEMERVELGSAAYAAVAQHALDVPADVPRGEQNCGFGDVVSGIDASGAVVCVADADADTLYSGGNFALSGQACVGDDLTVGVDASGALQCTSTVPWTALTSVPSGLDDGDQDTDTLDSLPCLSGDMVLVDPLTGLWSCVDHAGTPDAHHSDTSDGLAITPASVTLQGTATALTPGELDLGSAVDDVLTGAMVTTLTGGGQADSLHSHAAQAAAGTPTTLSTESATTMNFGDAARYCRDLTDGGFTDWRLGTWHEIWLLYQESVVSNALSTDEIWTGTADLGTGYYLLTIIFNTGWTGRAYGSEQRKTRCVR